MSREPLDASSRDYEMWSVEFPNGETRSCRSLTRLVWTRYEPRWLRRILNAVEDFVYEVRHGDE